MSFADWTRATYPKASFREPKWKPEKEQTWNGGGSDLSPAAPAAYKPEKVAEFTKASYDRSADYADTVEKVSYAEEDDRIEAPKYSLAKGIAGGAQKALTGIAQIGGSTAAMLEDIQYAPLELISGKKIGELSDKGFMNRWNDSIDRAADRVEDYYAENIAAGGVGAEVLDKLISGGVSAIPQALYTAYTGGAAAAPGLAQAAAREIPGTLSSIRNVAEKLASDPFYWLSASGTAAERYQETVEDDPPENAAAWGHDVAKSVGEGFYKEAIGTSDVVPDVISTLAELAYEMFEKKNEQEPDSAFGRAMEGMMKLFWR